MLVSPRPFHDPRFRFWISLLLASILMSADHYYALSQKLYVIIGLPAQSIISVANTAQELIESVEHYFVTLEQLTSDNESLNRELLQARHRLQEMQQLQEENLRLRQVTNMDILQRVQQAMVAQITHVSLAPFEQHVTIDRGSEEDLFVGQPVLDTYGIVGQVSKVGRHQSTVLLITDVRHAMSLRNARTGDVYLAEGDSHHLKLRYVPLRDNIKEGDVMLSSGLDEVYPGDYLVGKIARLSLLPSQDFLEAIIEVGSQVHRNRELLLVWPLAAAADDDADEDTP